MCPVLPATMAIKMKSRDQTHRRARFKGSRCHKYDQNQDKMPDVIIYNLHTLLTLVLHRATAVNSTVLCPLARIVWLSRHRYYILYKGIISMIKVVPRRCMCLPSAHVQMIRVGVSYNLAHNFTINIHIATTYVLACIKSSKLFCMTLWEMVQ